MAFNFFRIPLHFYKHLKFWVYLGAFFIFQEKVIRDLP